MKSILCTIGIHDYLILESINDILNCRKICTRCGKYVDNIAKYNARNMKEAMKKHNARAAAANIAGTPEWLERIKKEAQDID